MNVTIIFFDETTSYNFIRNETTIFFDDTNVILARKQVMLSLHAYIKFEYQNVKQETDSVEISVNKMK